MAVKKDPAAPTPTIDAQTFDHQPQTDGIPLKIHGFPLSLTDLDKIVVHACSGDESPVSLEHCVVGAQVEAAGDGVFPGGNYDAVASPSGIEGCLKRVGVVSLAIANGTAYGLVASGLDA